MGAMVLRLVALAQGAYYIITGVWPLLSRRSFERVTGPKTDFWLVRTVGLVLATAGTVLVMAGARKHITPEIGTLAVGNAAGLAAIDVIYSAKGRISPIYAVEAIGEVVLIAPWLMFIRSWLRADPHQP
jgi:hypothetical protein